MPTHFVVINLGTYEHVLATFWAWRKDADVVLCRPVASYTPHIGPITALGGHGATMVSGSADETLRVYDLLKRREVGRLDKHNGTVTALQLTADGTHMVTVSEDRTLCIWRTKDWECTRTLENVHGRGGALALALHPSGKAALTLGSKGVVRLWDLVHGKMAAAYKDSADATTLAWDRAGEYFAVAAGTAVALRTAEQPKKPHAVLKHPAAVLSLAFVQDGLLACGCADGKVRVWDLEHPEVPHRVLDAHSARVRAMSYLPPASKDTDPDALATLGAKNGLLLTAATDGTLFLWSCDTWEALTGDTCLLRVQAAYMTTIVPTSLPEALYAGYLKGEPEDEPELVEDDGSDDDSKYDSDVEVKQEDTSSSSGGEDDKDKDVEDEDEDDKV